MHIIKLLAFSLFCIISANAYSTTEFCLTNKLSYKYYTHFQGDILLNGKPIVSGLSNINGCVEIDDDKDVNAQQIKQAEPGYAGPKSTIGFDIRLSVSQDYHTSDYPKEFIPYNILIASTHCEVSYVKDLYPSKIIAVITDKMDPGDPGDPDDLGDLGYPGYPGYCAEDVMDHMSSPSWTPVRYCESHYGWNRSNLPYHISCHIEIPNSQPTTLPTVSQ